MDLKTGGTQLNLVYSLHLENNYKTSEHVEIYRKLWK